MDPRSHNRAAWVKKVEQQDRWTTLVSHEAMQRARQGQFQIWLTQTKPVLTAWFRHLRGTFALLPCFRRRAAGPLLTAARALVEPLQ